MDWTWVQQEGMRTELQRFPAVDHLFFRPDIVWLWASHYATATDISCLIGHDPASESRLALPLLRQPLLRGAVRQVTTLFGAEYMRSCYYAQPKGSFELSAPLGHLMQRAGDWDVLRCIYLPAAMVDECVRHCVAEGYPFLPLGSAHTRFIPIDRSFDEYLKTVRKKSVRETRRLRRKLSEQGELEMEILTRPEDLRRGLSSAYEISSRSWKAQRNSHVGGDTVLGRFYRGLFDLCLQDGSLTVYLMSHRGTPVAFMTAVRHGNTMYLVKTGYDLELEKYSVGSIVWLHVLEHLFADETLKTIDLLSDYDYLRLWTRDRREYKSLAIFNRRAKSRLLARAASLVLDIRRRRAGHDHLEEERPSGE